MSIKRKITKKSFKRKMLTKLTGYSIFSIRILTLLFIGFLLISATFGQVRKTKQTIKREKRLQQQTSFASEGKTDRPVKLSKNVLNQLSKVDDKRLERCQNSEDFPMLQKKTVSEHFTASKINVRSKKGGLDILVVKSNSGCFNGAHSARFWLFFKTKRDSAENYKLNFDVLTDVLSVSDKTSRIYPEIVSIYHTAVEFYSTYWKFNGKEYRTTVCYAEEIGSNKSKKIKCGN